MKKIVYFVGAYGSGKTTGTEYAWGKSLSEAADSLLEDSAVLYFIKKINPTDPYTLDIFMLMQYYYRIKRSIEKGFHPIFVDGHPLLPGIYLRAVFEMESGLTVSLRDLMEFGKLKYKMWKETQDMFSDWEQTIVYINLPLEDNWDFITKRYEERKDGFPAEADVDWLRSIRRILHSEIYHEVKELYDCKLIEVKSIKELNELNFDIPYPLQGG
jgi:hypothetical protein